MKKGFIAALVLLSILSIAGTAYAYNGKITQELEYYDIKVTLDGELLDLRDVQGNAVEPFMFNGTNYLPVRAISEALGLVVAWDGESNTAMLTTPQSEHTIYITRTGSKYHYNDSCNGGTYWEVPLSTALGFGLKPCDKCVHD